MPRYLHILSGRRRDKINGVIITKNNGRQTQQKAHVCRQQWKFCCGCSRTSNKWNRRGGAGRTVGDQRDNAIHAHDYIITAKPWTIFGLQAKTTNHSSGNNLNARKMPADGFSKHRRTTGFYPPNLESKWGSNLPTFLRAPSLPASALSAPFPSPLSSYYPFLRFIPLSLRVP